MDYTQQTATHVGGSDYFGLGLVNFEIHENNISHETQGLSGNHLVVRRGKPFKVTLLFKGRSWNPNNERLVLEVCLEGSSQKIPVLFEEQSAPQGWSATVPAGKISRQSVIIHVCSPVLSPVALYQLLVHIETIDHRMTYMVGTFVLLCNPWLKDDPVYMQQDAHIKEYIKNDYGLIFTGTPSNVQERPWSFGQYEPGVLDACLKLLQLSNEHLHNSSRDYALRADPVYISRVICAMVNSNDDLGVLLGRWKDNYTDGVKPTDWSGSADILHQWLSSNGKPVRYGQCWVFASVLCTVMRVLGIPSRVVTVFTAAHDADGNTTIEEFYTTSGEKLSLSDDSIWNFHVWVECWMRRLDLGAEFDGWQVVDPTPQEKSGGMFRCGPCPVAAIKHCINVPFDTRFLYAAVDGDVHRLIIHNGSVVGRTVDTECVGELIYTKSIGSDTPQNLTNTYKGIKRPQDASTHQCELLSYNSRAARSGTLSYSCMSSHTGSSLFASPQMYSASITPADDAVGETSCGLQVSITIPGSPLLGANIDVCVKVTNHSSRPRDLMEHVNAQQKEYNRDPQQSFWRAQREVHIQTHQALTLRHTIPYSEYESTLKPDSVVNVAVVMQDLMTRERVLGAHEFSVSTAQITIQIEGGDRIQMKKEKSARVTFTNPFERALSEAVLSVEGSGLIKGKQEAKLLLLKPGENIKKTVSIMATSPGTKVLKATLSHSSSSIMVSRSFHKVSVSSA
ncbi:protein-glutamine gamma-glutamyltransferase 5 [Nematolebias whitei]|uniref:protein-glutamine gamma-glutamyltransferase 5 n=1 Tax=Nematolebias whitei TaxID=451745 RepID=UPI0018997FCA|nr:protein-glutamine gamma-glutamyltransferase 5 [Nematolebias whitei]